MTDRDEKARGVLERFGLSPDTLIAHSGESSVYALDADRVLRVGPANAEHVVRKYVFFREIEAAGLPWPLPRLLDRGVIDGMHFVIEDRLPGRSLDMVLQDVTGDARARALANYAEAALRVREACVQRPWFGELYYDPHVRDPSWPRYLAARARLHVDKAGEAFATEVPLLPQILERFADDVCRVEEIEPGLVHGDYYPGNVLVDDDLAITGVIDFGWSTLVGDPRLDAVCASVFLEVDRPWSTLEDAAFVREHIRERDPSIEPVFDLYRTYCALHFSFVIHYGIALSRWCVRTLNED